MKKITFFLSLLFITFFSSKTFSQTTLNFNGGFQTIASGSGTQSGTITLSDGNVYLGGTSASGGFTFMSRNGAGQISVTNSGTIAHHHFGRNDGLGFQLDNLNLLFNISNTTSATLTGFKNGSMVSGATQAITFAQNIPQTVDVSSNTAFDDIDEIRFTFSTAPDNNGNLILNSLTYSPEAGKPIFENSTPNQSSVAETSFTLETDIDEAGTIYYVVVADGASAPTSAEVKAGTGNGGSGQITSGSASVSTGGFTNNFNVTGLTAGTAYDVYTVAEDDEVIPNIQSSPAKIDVTTASIIALTITGLTGDNKSYDGTTVASTSGTASLAGVSGGDDVTITGTPIYTFASSNVGTGIAITTTGYTLGGADAGKYVLTQPSFTADITQAPLTVTADSGLSKVYGSSDPALTYTITGFIGADNEADLDTPVSISRAAGENVANYVITPAGATDSNYSVSFVTSTFAIIPETLIVTADSGFSKVYGSSDPALTYTITGFVGADNEADLDTPVSISRAAGENAANYIITPAGATDSNYSVSFVTSTFAITQAPLTVTADSGISKVYGATDPTLTYTITGFVNGDVEGDLDTPVSISRAAGENVANYVITPSDAADTNYSVSFVTSTFGITPAALTVTADSGLSKVYGATDPALTYTITGFVGADNEADLDTPVSISRAAGENVANYIVTPSGAIDSNYSINFITNTFGITPAALTVTADSGLSKVYGATDSTLTYTITGFVNGDVEGDLDTPVSISRAAGENVANYVVTPADAADTNYSVSFVTSTFGITQAALTVTANSGLSKVYGATDPTLTYTITGFVNGDVEGDLDTPVSISRAAGENVANYVVTPAGATDSNYSISFVTSTFGITQAALTVTANSGLSKVYGATDPTLTYTITGFVNGDVEGDLDTPVSISRAAGENVANYVITPAGATDSNYSISFVTSTFGITQAALTITADSGLSKVYGATDPALTYTITGFVNGDLEGDLDTPVTISRASGENVANYVVTPASAADTNYSVSFATSTFAITQAALTVTADSGLSKVYGTTDPTLTYTITGFVNGDVEGDLDTPVSISRAAGENVANYVVTPADAADTNYSVSFVTSTFGITQAALTVTANSGLSKVYGATDPTLTYTITGFVNGDVEGDLDTPVSISRASGENVANYVVTPASAADTNYSVSFVTTTFGITQAALTVTADSGLSKVYGATDPALTYTITGFVGADNEADLDTPVSISRAAGENVANYVVTPAGATDSNYSVSFVTSTFGITPATLTISGLTGNDKVFDGTTNATASGTASLSGVVGADDVTLNGSPVFTFASSNIGTGITITTTGYIISGTDAGNYTLTQPTLSANITGDALAIDDISTIDVTCNGDADGSATVTVSGGSAPYSYQWSTGATTTVNVFNGLQGGNYSVTVVDALNNSVTQSFTIVEGEPLDVTVTEEKTVYRGYYLASYAWIGVEEVLGGEGPYTYEWSNGETTQRIHVCPTETTTYTVTVTDANGCSTTADVVVNVVDVRCNNHNHYGHHKFVKLCKNGKTICVPWWKVRWYLWYGYTLGGCDTDVDEVQITNLKVYPNPFRRNLNVEFNSTMDADVDLIIFNNRGRKVFEKTISITQGTTTTRLNLSKLRRGSYYLKVVVNGEVKKIRHLIKYRY